MVGISYCKSYFENPVKEYIAGMNIGYNDIMGTYPVTARG
jgi:hypothetical protein